LRFCGYQSPWLDKGRGIAVMGYMERYATIALPPAWAVVVPGHELVVCLAC
jgi:hypothetical protein